MNRRNFLKRAILGVSAIAALNSIPLSIQNITVPLQTDYVAWLYWSVNMYVSNPRNCGIITGIT